MANLEKDHASAVSALRQENFAAVAEIFESFKQRKHANDIWGCGNQAKRVVVTVDVEEANCPIELMVWCGSLLGLRQSFLVVRALKHAVGCAKSVFDDPRCLTASAATFVDHSFCKSWDPRCLLK